MTVGGSKRILENVKELQEKEEKLKHNRVWWMGKNQTEKKHKIWRLQLLEAQKKFHWYNGGGWLPTPPRSMKRYVENVMGLRKLLNNEVPDIALLMN